MILLSATMLILGLLAFFDTIFNYGNMFRYMFSGLLIVMSVWVFIKSRSMNDLLKTSDTGTTNTDNYASKTQMNHIEKHKDKKPQAVS
jgi:cytochrome c biogenesis protein CcdA